jgi:hypothetical protein
MVPEVDCALSVLTISFKNRGGVLGAKALSERYAVYTSSRDRASRAARYQLRRFCFGPGTANDLVLEFDYFEGPACDRP